MQSVANNGLKQRLLEHYKREILNGYGAEHLVTLQRLENAGLIRVQETKSFSVLRKALRLVVDRVDEIVRGCGHRNTCYYDYTVFRASQQVICCESHFVVWNEFVP